MSLVSRVARGVAVAVVLTGATGGGAGADTPSPQKTVKTSPVSRLDAARARADACEEDARAAYGAGVNKPILLALAKQTHCIEAAISGLAHEFYPQDAFGEGGVDARIAEVRRSLGGVYRTIYAGPGACAPDCGDIYRIWAAEAYVSSIRIVLDDMIDRLKDESPLRQP